jgi:hypothetical protein
MQQGESGSGRHEHHMEMYPSSLELVREGVPAEVIEFLREIE